jgi:hypothetical protein
MKLKATKINMNGTTSAVVRAFSDDDQFLGFEDTVDCSIHRQKVNLVKNLEKELGSKHKKQLKKDPNYFLNLVSQLYVDIDAQYQQSKSSTDSGGADGADDADALLHNLNIELERKSQATQLVEMALAQGADLWHDPDDRAWATLRFGGHYENWPLKSGGFRRWLRRLFYQATGKAPAAQGVLDAIGVLEGKACFDGEQQPVYSGWPGTTGIFT